MLSHAELLSLLTYDPVTGVFTWRVQRGNKRSGDIAGSVNCINGYVEIRIKTVAYYSHRLAWFYQKGTWPQNQIDHKNNIRNDNSFNNLQEASLTQNNKKLNMKNNNTSGYKGVTFDRRRGTYSARITSDLITYNLGAFTCPAEAASVYDLAATHYHGIFAKTNKELRLL